MRCALWLTAAVAIVSVPSVAHVRAESGRSSQDFPLPDIDPRAPRAQQNMEARLIRLEQWLKAAMRHEPGTTDDAAARVSAWSNSELRALWIDTNVVVQLIRNPKAAKFTLRAEGQRTSQEIRYSTVQFHRIRALACAAAGMLAEPRCLCLPEVLPLHKSSGRDFNPLVTGAARHTWIPAFAGMTGTRAGGADSQSQGSRNQE